ncbi:MULTISPECIES: AAA family ATPase [unclassified Acinetobacter]|uniref:AAA family ATPase n=1 Tax=unclassified Acinetobacter TaxID=196816 RepID=UPI000761D78A|nr:AAA family ATPase [Acinetobacter sp. LMB-5]
MKNFTLKAFKILNLNNEYDVSLEFRDNKKIIVSENGSGKTTILNIFYSFFSLDYKSISTYNFDSIIIILSNNLTYKFSKLILRSFLDSERLNSLNDFINSDFIEIYKDFIQRNNINPNKEEIRPLNSTFTALIYLYVYENKFSSKVIKNTSSIIKSELKSKNNNEILKIIKDYEDILSLYFQDYNDIFQNYETSLKNEQNINELYLNIKSKSKNQSKNIIEDMQEQLKTMEVRVNLFKEFKDLKIIYLPTYRRIEHNIDSLFDEFSNNELNYEFMINSNDIKEKFMSNKLIQFGIEDIENTWRDISINLRKSMIDGFNKFSGLMLKNSISFKNPTKNQIQGLSEKINTIKIIFERLGEDNISKETKNKIIELLSTKNQLNHEKYNFLYYMLINLIKIYENQEKSEINIKKFVNISNEFFNFNNKKIIYDENNVDIKILKKYKKEYKTIELNNLSSGEKQIISLFTRLLLKETSEEVKYWIIIDEPELSLSIEWQKILLPNILKTDRCEFLFATTHSPFIFSNDLKINTADLSLEMKESNND